MADKEATVYIVDCGKSMGERRHGREVTDLDWAMQYVWDRITGTVRSLFLRIISYMKAYVLDRWPLDEKWL